MSDSTSEREKRLRSLLSQKKDKSGLGVVSQGQAELLGMQNELQNTVAQQQLQDQSNAQTNSMMQQMALGAISEGGGNQVTMGRQVGRMNPYTQNIMQKYGVKPENSHRTQSSTIRQVSGQNTTNVRNETTTNNRTEIKITQPQIPIAQPQIPVAQPQRSGGSNNVEKFKVWMNNMFAKQQNEAEIQRKEYRKKEWAISRNTSKLMKKISDATNNLSDKLNPEYRNQSITGQLKWLFLLFGATVLGKMWKPLMMWLENFEGGFRMAFGLPMNDTLRANSSDAYSFIGRIQEFLGVSKDKSLLQGIGEVVSDGVGRLIDHVKLFFEDRGMALREIEFPKIDAPDFGMLNGILGPAVDSVTSTFRGMAQYLGDILTVAIGGSHGRVKVEARKIQRKAMDTFTDTTGKQTSMGENSLAQGKGGRNYLRKSDFNSLTGDLKADAGSTHAMTRNLMSLLKDRSNTSHAAEIATGIEQLFKVADREGQVTIDPDFLASLGLTRRDILQLQQSKQLKMVPYKMIKVRPDRDDLNEVGKLSTGWAEAGKIAGGVGSLFLPGTGYLKAAGSAVKAAKAAKAAKTLKGVGAGTALKQASGSIFKSGIISGLTGLAGGMIDDTINTSRLNSDANLVYKIVPMSSREGSVDGSAPIVKPMLTLTREGADYVTSLLAGKKGRASLTDENFYKRIQAIEKGYKIRSGVSGPLVDGIDTNDLRARQHQAAEYDARQERISTREGAWNTTMGNISNAFSNMGSSLADELRGMSMKISSGGQGRVSTSEFKARINHCMKFFIERGLTHAQAAGIVGNLMEEGLALKDLGHETWDVNGPSAGIAQFHQKQGVAGGDLYYLKQWARENGRDWTDLDTQLEFIWNYKRGKRSIDRIIKETAGMNDAEAAAHSSFIFGHDYEVFRGYQDYNGKSHKKRREHAIQALGNYDPSNTTITNYISGSINLNDLNENRESYPIGWLGDSHSTSVLVPTVSKQLSTPIGYYGHCATVPQHFLDASTKLSDSCKTAYKTNLGVTNCTDALNKIITLKPSYVILEFGHNGTTGFASLIGKLQENDIKVIVIRMWPMKNETVQKATSKYNGLSPDGWIDLTNLFGSNTSMFKDNAHLTNSGYVKAAEEIVKQLRGGASDQQQSEEGNGFTDLIAKGLNTIADWLDPNTKKSTTVTPYDLLTEEEKKVRQEILQENEKRREFGKKSWMELGAKEDATGSVYLKSGNARVYLKTDAGHNGLFGIHSSDIDFISSDDPSKSLSSKEIELAESSVIRDIRAYFMENPNGGKGSRSKDYDNYLKDPSTGKMTLFDLCLLPSLYPEKNKDRKRKSIVTITDMKMKAPAKKDFDRVGGVHLLISPNTTLTGYTVVSLDRQVGTSFNLFGVEDLGNIDMVFGLEIYHKGSTKWFQVGTTPKQQIYSDYQPICQIMDVKLEKSADAKFRVSKLLSLLALTSRISIQGSDLKYKDTGEYVDPETRAALNDLGLTTQGVNTPLKWTGRGNAVQTHYSDGQRALSEAGYDKLYKTFGKNKTEREKYYSEHKKDFIEVGGKIYHKSTGLEIGTSDNGLYENKELEAALGQDPEKIKLTLQNNIEKISDSQGFDSQLGSVNVDTLGKFVQKIVSADVTGGTTKTNKYNSGVSSIKTSVNFNFGTLGFKQIPVEVRNLPDGTMEYSTTRSNIARALGGELVGADKKLTVGSLPELERVVKHFVNSHSLQGIHATNLKKLGSISNNSSAAALQEILSQRKIVRLIEEYENPRTGILQTKVTFEDGSTKSFENVRGLVGKENEINKHVGQIIAALRNEAADEAFKDTGLEQQFKDAYEDVKTNPNNYFYSDGYVRSKQTGMIVGTYDPKKDPDHKNIKAIAVGSEAFNTVGADFLDGNLEVRRSFNKNLLGLNSNGTITLKNGKTVSINTDRSITSLLKEPNVEQAFLRDAQFTDGTRLNEKERNELLKRLKASIEKTGGLQAALLQSMMDTSEIEAEKQRKERIDVEKKEEFMRNDISSISQNVYKIAKKEGIDGENPDDANNVTETAAQILKDNADLEGKLGVADFTFGTGDNAETKRVYIDTTQIPNISPELLDDHKLTKEEREGLNLKKMKDYGSNESYFYVKSGDTYYQVYENSGNVRRAPYTLVSN